MSGELVFDLNALFIYAKVVEHGGFAPAGRVLGIPKSTISRKVAQLEARLGVRLVQRSTRQFQVTEIGQAYYRHCVAMTVEAEAAEDVIEQNRSEPCGMVRLTCSTPLLHFELAPMLARFMAQYPNVELYVKTFNRRVDVIAEGYDISLSLRFPPLEDSDLVMKVLARSPQVLVASPELLARYRPPELPADLSAMPYVGWERSRLDGSLRLVGADGSSAALNLRPQLLSDDLGTLRRRCWRASGSAACRSAWSVATWPSAAGAGAAGVDAGGRHGGGNVPLAARAVAFGPRADRLSRRRLRRRRAAPVPGAGLRLSDRRPGRRVGAVAGSRRWTSRSRPAAGTRHRRPGGAGPRPRARRGAGRFDQASAVSSSTNAGRGSVAGGVRLGQRGNPAGGPGRSLPLFR